MEADKTVFVVHGRNKQIRDAAFSYLRALGLSPLEWEQACAKTDMASPTNLEIVADGMAACCCAVILWTGDDNVHLRLELGDESEHYQPRPNVLIEMGMAFEKFGRERTIIACAKHTPLPSDYQGLNWLPLSDQATVRKEFARRLKDAGCKVDDSGTDFLEPRKTGSFDGFAATPAKSRLLVRGGFDDFIADSTVSHDHQANTITLYRRAEDYLRHKDNVGLKFNYLGAHGAQNWLNVSEDPNFVHATLYDEYARVARTAVERICECNRDIDFISLGTGNGKTDILFLEALEECKRLVNVYPLDMSFELLQKSVSNIVTSNGLEREFNLKAIHGDFLELNRYRPVFDHHIAVNFFTLLGFMLGNYAEGVIIRSIREAMNPGDYLLLDARLHDIPLDETHERHPSWDNLAGEYLNPKHKKFAFGVVDALTDAKYSDVDITYDIDRSVTSIEGALNITLCLNNFEAKLKRDGTMISRDRLPIAVTTKYHEQSLLEWLASRGFDIVWTNKKGRAISILLRKKLRVRTPSGDRRQSRAAPSS